MLDLELNEGILNEENLEELCQTVDACETLQADFKQGFFQRKLEILEDFGSNVHKIVKEYETYQKKFKVKPGVFLGKRHIIDNR